MAHIRKNWLEWMIFGIGLLLVTGTVGWLAWDAWTSRLGAIQLEVQVGLPESRPGYFTLPVRVINHGDKSAEQVHVEVVLTRKDGGHDRAVFQVAFVPRHSSRKGWVTFQTDPASAERIAARPLGFEEP